MLDYLKSSSTGNFFLLAEPCVIEGEEMALSIAEKVLESTTRLNIPYVFKGSYHKANCSRISPDTMRFAVQKVIDSGNKEEAITECDTICCGSNCSMVYCRA